MPKFELMLARRFLFSREGKSLLSAITGIAVLGLSVGVAALVLTLGVMDGAEKELFAKYIDLYPHVKLRSALAEELAKPEPILEMFRKQEGVALAEPVIEKEALFSPRMGATGELVAGRIMAVGGDGKSGVFHLRNAAGGGAMPDPGPNEILVGKPFAEKLGVKAGDAVLAVTGLTSNRTNRQSSGKMFKVAGIYDSGYYAFDSMTAVVSMATARESLASGKGADYIHVRMNDPHLSRFVQSTVQLEFGPSYRVTTWMEESRGFFPMLKIQKLALYLILMLIILVAGFNIIGTLILMVLEKTREIGILAAIGSSRGMLLRTFLFTGAWIGLLGTALGVAMGLLGCYLLGNVVRFEMPPSVYNFEHLPVLVKPLTVGIIVVSAMAVCLVASFFPAYQASRLDPVDALRHD